MLMACTTASVMDASYTISCDCGTATATVGQTVNPDNPEGRESLATRPREKALDDYLNGRAKAPWSALSAEPHNCRTG